MSSNLPLRTIRIPALQRQCLFQRRQPRAFSTSAPHAFASTSPRLRGQQLGRADKAQTKAAVKSQVGPAPRVNFEKAQTDADLLAEDIGLLQDTVIRATSFKKLPAVWVPAFWGYFWKLLKSKATALYSRGAYNRCIYKKGIRSYLPIDRFNNVQLKDTAKKLYELLYHNFAKGDIHPIARFCLPPLTRNFKTRIAGRGPLKMEWKLLRFNSVRVVSHRAQPLGEEQPDTAYRQAVIRIDSTQELTLSGNPPGWSPSASKSSSPKGLRWVPDEAKKARNKKVDGVERRSEEFLDNGKEKRVVEYLVLQTRVIRGQEEDWKVWGFAQESTPETIDEDAAYWRKTLDAQAASI